MARTVKKLKVGEISGEIGYHLLSENFAVIDPNSYDTLFQIEIRVFLKETELKNNFNTSRAIQLFKNQIR